MKKSEFTMGFESMTFDKLVNSEIHGELGLDSVHTDSRIPHTARISNV